MLITQPAGLTPKNPSISRLVLAWTPTCPLNGEVRSNTSYRRISDSKSRNNGLGFNISNGKVSKADSGGIYNWTGGFSAFGVGRTGGGFPETLLRLGSKLFNENNSATPYDFYLKETSTAYKLGFARCGQTDFTNRVWSSSDNVVPNSSVFFAGVSVGPLVESVPRFFYNGTFENGTTGDTATGTPGTNSADFVITQGVNAGSAACLMVAIFFREMSDAEMLSYWRNPWQVFFTPKQPIGYWALQAAAAGQLHLVTPTDYLPILDPNCAETIAF